MYESTSVRAVIIQEGQLLVEWFAPLAISFLPGGTAEAGENLLATLTRELTEEITPDSLNIGSYVGQIGHIWRKSNGTTGSCLNHFFEARFGSPVPFEEVQSRETGRILKWLPLAGGDFSSLQPPSLKNHILERLNGNLEEWNTIDNSV